MYSVYYPMKSLRPLESYSNGPHRSRFSRLARIATRQCEIVTLQRCQPETSMRAQDTKAREKLRRHYSIV